MTTDDPSSRRDDPARTSPPSSDARTPPSSAPAPGAGPAAGPVPARDPATAGPATPSPTTPSPTTTNPATTRAAAAWLATAAALVVLALLIVLILQNQETVEVHYLGLAGSLPLGTALLIAAVAGGAIVLIVGVVRLTQLRVQARRARRREKQSPTRVAPGTVDGSTPSARTTRRERIGRDDPPGP